MRSEHLANLALANSTRRPSKMERFAPPRPVLRLREILFGVGIVVVMTVADVHHEVLTMKIINSIQDAIMMATLSPQSSLRPPSRNVGGRRMSAHKHAESIRLYAEDAFQTTEPWVRWEFSEDGARWCQSTFDPTLVHRTTIPPQGQDHHRRWSRASCA